MNRRPLCRYLLAAALPVIVAACQPAHEEIALAGAVQGTTYHVKLVPADKFGNELGPRSGPRKGEPQGWDEQTPTQPAELQQAIEAVYEDIDRKLSNYREDSEISHLNRQETTDWLDVSPEIAELVAIAREVHAKSNGCYDLTVKPLFDLWGFSRHQNRVPSDAEIDALLPHVGMDKLEVDVPGRRIRKKDPMLRIDLSSIAQGYTVGRVAALLETRGIGNYLVEIGGEMRVKGGKANGSAWRVAIEKPLPYTREVERVLEVQERRGVAIMTSGTYRNFFQEGGKHYSHILDPKTGRPVTHRLLSVTVLHEDPTWADAWSTALLCLGETDGYRSAEREGLKALFISQENGEPKEHYTPAFRVP